MFSTYLVAQETARAHHLRYRLIEIETFGGPNSVYNVFSRIASNDAVVGAANTVEPDPNPSVCFDGDTCLVQHLWEWRKGMLTDLGALTDGFSSYTNAINHHRVIVGQSQNRRSRSSDRRTLNVPSHGLGARKNSFPGEVGGANSIAIAVTYQNFVIGVAENGIVDTSGFARFDGVSQIHAFGWSGVSPASLR